MSFPITPSPHPINLLITDTEETIFRFRPTPSCRLSLTRRLQILGRAGSHRFAQGERRCDPPASNRPTRSLTAFVSCRHDSLLTNGTSDGTTDGTRSSDERRGEKRDEKRDERMERQQIQEKRAGRRHPASLPACFAWFYVPDSAIVRRFRISRSRSRREIVSC